LRYDLPITLEEAAFGCNKLIEIEKYDTCETCTGAGSPSGGMKTCTTCFPNAWPGVPDARPDEISLRASNVPVATPAPMEPGELLGLEWVMPPAGEWSGEDGPELWSRLALKLLQG
jgi:hypothetical protein